MVSPWVSLVAQLVKNPPAMQETWVRSLVWVDPLEKEWLHALVFLPGKFYGLSSPWGGKESDMTEQLSVSLYGFPGGLVVKNPPAVQETWETWVQSLGQEYPLEEEIAIHSSILARKIPWTEDPGRL